MEELEHSKSESTDPSSTSNETDQMVNDPFPTGIHKEALLSFGERLKNLARWQEWSDCSPLMLMLDPEKLRLQPFDEALQEHLWHLEAISHKPHTHLKIEIERVPVHRVRRVPTRAFEYLASHTEDWESRRVTGIVPRRVLSTQPDDLYNLYENRLTARLIFEIERYLKQRLQIEDEALNNYKEYKDGFGIHQRQGRVFRLWGQVFDEGQNENYEEVRRIHHDLQVRSRRLFDDTLFRAISKSSRNSVPKVVRITNILTHDSHYRYINVLWKKWLERPENKQKMQEELQREHGKMIEGFEHYCLLVFIRALGQLGFETIETDQISHDTPLWLKHTGLGRRFQLVWIGDQGELCLNDENGYTNLHIVPKFAALTAGNLSSVEAKLAELKDWLRKQSRAQSFTVIIYPGMLDERVQLPDRLKAEINSPIGHDKWRGTGVIPIYAYDQNSVERLGRAIRWAIWQPMLLEYPPQVKVPRSLRSQILEVATGWLSDKPHDRDCVELRQQPTPTQWDSIKNEIRSWDGEYTQKGRSGEAERQHLRQFKDDLEKAIEYMRNLLICPVCSSNKNDRNFSRRDKGFECHCEGCNAHWGVNVCGSCKKNYPFIDHMNENLQLTQSISDPDWAERNYGMDILALPCPKAVKSSFVCPYCRRCPEYSSEVACIYCNEGQE